MNIKEAIAIHMQWKMTFSLQIALQEPLLEQQMQLIHNQNLCMLGQWLQSPDTLPIRTTAEYAEVMRQHTRFHREMAQVAALINAGDYARASELLVPDSTFQLVSRNLTKALTMAGWLVKDAERRQQD